MADDPLSQTRETVALLTARNQNFLSTGQRDPAEAARTRALTPSSSATCSSSGAPTPRCAPPPDIMPRRTEALGDRLSRLRATVATVAARDAELEVTRRRSSGSPPPSSSSPRSRASSLGAPSTTDVSPTVSPWKWDTPSQTQDPSPHRMVPTPSRCFSPQAGQAPNSVPSFDMWKAERADPPRYMVGSAAEKACNNQDALAKTMETIALLTARHARHGSGDAHELVSPRKRPSAVELYGAHPGEDACRAHYDAPSRAQEAAHYDVPSRAREAAPWAAVDAPRDHLGAAHDAPQKDSPPRGVPTIDMSRLKAEREDLARQLCRAHNAGTVTPKDLGAIPSVQFAVDRPGGPHELAGMDPRRLV